MTGRNTYLLGPFFSVSLSEEDESSVDSSSEVVFFSSSSSLSDAPAQKREACSVCTAHSHTHMSERGCVHATPAGTYHFEAQLCQE